MLAPIALVGDEDPAPLQVEAVDVGLVEVGRAVDMTRRAERREKADLAAHGVAEQAVVEVEVLPVDDGYLDGAPAHGRAQPGHQAERRVTPSEHYHPAGHSTPTTTAPSKLIGP